MTMNAKSQWLVNRLDTLAGPYPEGEILEMLRVGTLSWGDFIWNPGSGFQWCRVYEVPVFQAYLPPPPSAELIRRFLEAPPVPPNEQAPMAQPPRLPPQLPPAAPAEAPAAPAAPLRQRSIWYMQFEGSEFGPLSMAEVRTILKSGKLKGQIHARRDGPLGWAPVEEIEELKDLVGKTLPTGNNRRKESRVALVATVRFSGPGEVSAGKLRFTGVCRDISLTGMMVATNQIPGVQGSPIRVDVQPMGMTGLNGFQADAEIIRVHAGGKGFSVRFRVLDDLAKAALEKYLRRR